MLFNFTIRHLPRLIYAVIIIIISLALFFSIYIFEQRKRTVVQVEVITEYHLPSMAALNKLLIELNIIESYASHYHHKPGEVSIHTYSNNLTLPSSQQVYQHIYLAKENLNILISLHAKYSNDLFLTLINKLQETSPDFLLRDLPYSNNSSYSVKQTQLSNFKTTISQLRRLHLQQSSHSAKQLTRNANKQVGNIIPLSVFSLIIGGILIGIIIYIIHRTINLQHAYAQELEQHRENLTGLIDERTRELRDANKEMESFCYSISHDLRSPLRAMNAYSQFLIDDHEKDLDEDALHYLDRIRDNSIRMAELIDALLGLSKIGKYDIKHQTIDMNEICKEALENAHDNYPEQSVKYHCDITSNINGDPNLLRLVMENLFSNAIKYSRNRAVSEITVTETLQDGRTVFCVKDNGVGFDMKYAQKVFGIFQQLHRINEYDGTGIGLATTNRIIQRHGGEIWAESEPDKGATFCFSVSNQPIISS